MKLILTLCLILNLNSYALAVAPEPTTEITFHTKNISQKIKLYESEKPGQYRLSILNNKTVKNINISKLRGQFINNEAQQILWNLNYRTPANVVKCTEYATISNSGLKSKICLENATATGRTYGLLQFISALN